VAETDGSAAWIGIDLALARPPEEEIHLMDSRNWTYPLFVCRLRLGLCRVPARTRPWPAGAASLPLRCTN
jgi:hypothetical protein